MEKKGYKSEPFNMLLELCGTTMTAFAKELGITKQGLRFRIRTDNLYLYMFELLAIKQNRKTWEIVKDYEELKAGKQIITYKAVG